MVFVSVLLMLLVLMLGCWAAVIRRKRDSAVRGQRVEADQLTFSMEKLCASIKTLTRQPTTSGAVVRSVGRSLVAVVGFSSEEMRNCGISATYLHLVGEQRTRCALNVNL